MSKKQLKTLLIAIGVIFLIGIAIDFTLNFFDTGSYVLNYFKPILFYIPLGLLVISAFFFVLKMLVDKRKILFGRLSITFCAMTLAYITVIFSMLVSCNTKNALKIEAVQQLFTAERLIFPKKDFLEDSLNPNNQSYPMSIGKTIVCGRELTEYRASDNTRASVEAYYFENISALHRKTLLTKLEEQYFHNTYVTEYRIKASEIFAGSQGETNYRYCYSMHYRDLTDTYRTYFAIILQNESTVVLVSICLHHKANIEWDVTRMVDNLISSVSKLPA